MLLACLFPVLSDAQQTQQQAVTTLSISGFVLSDRGNTRIQGAVVQLCNSDGRLIEERRTRDMGEFTFNGVLPGVYELKIAADGYEPTEYKPDFRLIASQSFTVYMKAEQMNVVSTISVRPVSAHVLSMPRKARDLYQSGMNKLYQEKNVEGALEDFEKAYQRAPKFYEAHFQSGMAMLRMGKGAEAEARFRKSLELSENKFAGANVALGVLLFDRNDTEGATAYFQHALELSPSAWIASYKMGEIAYRRGDLVQAEKWARQAKQSDNESTLMDQLLLEIHMKQKNYPAAIQDIEAYLENDPLSEKADQMRELQDKLKNQTEK